jgi:large subunit ribosomal protein L29
MSVSDLQSRLAEYRRELLRLKTAAARGTVAKESGKIRNVRKAIARVKTVLREQGVRS